MKRMSIRTSTFALTIAWAVLGGLAGCSLHANRPAASPSTPRSPAAATERGMVTTCGAEIAGREDLTAPIVVLGETHGAAEIPAAFGRLVCHAATKRRDQTVLVGLEIPSSAQPAIDTFLDGDGGPQARKAVLDQEFWRRDFQDGRSSKARLDLLDDLRRYRASGLKLVVRAIDVPNGESAEDRDAWMAAAIAEAIETIRPAQTLVLVGDVHSRILKGYPWNPAADYLPMGAHLRAKYADTIGLNTTASGGSAWMCLSAVATECGPEEVRAREITGETPRIALDPEALQKRGWSGTLFIGKLTMSPPARLEVDGDVPGR